jgi:hypothetical protein
MLKMAGTLFAGLTVLFGIWWFGAASALTKTALLQPRGDNVTPRYFGLPAQINEAASTLNKLGFRLYSVEKADHCMFHPLGRPTRVIIFSDTSWRQGTLCIVPNGNKVSEVYWLFQPGAP